MATIKRLCIQGVRSFNPEDNKAQWIDFGTPLTLILGINGSGKTTIIEALKFVITSQFPPNSSKGASFVNDPKLTFTESSLAKITLNFVDRSGNKYTTTRKVKTQVKNNKGDLTTSQLEATLRKGNVQLTTKCQDIKVEMCRIMGVSEAILNHVIFCHQEESCWPLDEGKKVKEIFDAIFNTTAYKKCFDRLGNVDKELGIKVKVEAEGLKYVEENRQSAIRYREDLENQKIMLQGHTDAINEYEKEIDKMDKKLEEFRQVEHEYSKKHAEVVKKREKIMATTAQIAELKSNIKEEFKGSIPELQAYIDNFMEECSAKKKQVVQDERKYKQVDNEWSKLQNTKSELLKEEGAFQQQEKTNKKRVEELESLMQDAVACLKTLKEKTSEDILSTSFSNCLDTCDHQMGSLNFDIVNKALASAIRRKDEELQTVKASFDSEEKDLQKVVNEVRGKVVAMEKERDMKNQQLSEARNTYDDLKTRLKELEGSNEKLKLLDDDEQNYLERIENIEKSGFMLKCNSEIKELAVEVKDLDSKMSSVSSTLSLLNADKSKTDQIALLNRQKLQKQNDCNEIMRKMEDDLKQLLEDVPEDNLGAAVVSKLKSLNAELKQKKSELRKNEGDLAVTKSRMKHEADELRKLEMKLKKFKDQITDILDNKDYNTFYEELASELDKTQSESYYAESASYLYKKYITKLKKKPCCPLCKRDFEAREEANKLVSEIEGDVTRMQENLPNLKDDVERLKKQQQTVLKMKPVWEEIQKLSDEAIPNSKSKKAELETTLEKLREENDELVISVSAVESDIAVANQCHTNVALFEQNKKEQKKIDEQIMKIERSRDPEAKACTTTLTDAETELEELKRTIRSKRSEKESKEDMRNKKRDELAKLHDMKNKVKEEKLKITAELQNREALEDQKKELEASKNDLVTKIAELTKQLPSIKAEIAEAERNKNSCIQRREKALLKIRDEKLDLEKRKTSIADKNKQITEFERYRSNFAQVIQRLEECNKMIKDCEQQKTEISNAVNKLKKEIVNQQIKERELRDNLSLKEKSESISQLKVELKQEEKLLSQSVNPSFAAEKKQLQETHRRKEAKLNEMKGQQIELTKSIKNLEKELALPQFANAEREYIQRLAKKITYEKAQRDVRRYKTALDTAIMQFHKKRMEKINKILLDYWRRIYRGNDIDRIMIKTEADKDPALAMKPNKVKVTAGTTRKNYNYRVVMVRRGGVELDMRGRCSAGQRVLASIIIRIALAESFGARCGIISLDEPTTNLDQKNINSLADALADLAEKMSSRRNFQLIVITHDQEFTERLSGIDVVEKYWKVDRDKDGFSRIQMIPKANYVGEDGDEDI